MLDSVWLLYPQQKVQQSEHTKGLRAWGPPTALRYKVFRFLWVLRHALTKGVDPPAVELIKGTRMLRRHLDCASRMASRRATLSGLLDRLSARAVILLILPFYDSRISAPQSTSHGNDHAGSSRTTSFEFCAKPSSLQRPLKGSFAHAHRDHDQISLTGEG